MNFLKLWANEIWNKGDQSKKEFLILNISTIFLLGGGVLVYLSVLINLVARNVINEGFYFTLLYKDPNSPYISIRIGYSLFGFGYIIICISEFSIILLDYMRIKGLGGIRNRISFLVGCVTIITSMLLFANPGGYLTHGVMAIVVMFEWNLFLGILNAKFLILSILSTLLLTIFYLTQRILLFSFFQHLSAFIFTGEFLYHFWITFKLVINSAII